MTLNMKLKLSCAALLLAAVLAAPAWGATQDELSERFWKKCEQISEPLWDMAEKTVAYNKPTSTKYDKGDKCWYRGWKKNGTEVEAVSLKKNGKYYARSIKTTDPNLVFAGGIRVGASVSVLENHFKGLLNRDLGVEDSPGFYMLNELPPGGSGAIMAGGTAMSFAIEFKNGKITAISCWERAEDNL